MVVAKRGSWATRSGSPPPGERVERDLLDQVATELAQEAHQSFLAAIGGVVSAHQYLGEGEAEVLPEGASFPKAPRNSAA
jgi:hypothetical protein